MVGNSRARINKLVMGVFSFVEEECHTNMLHHDMDISRLIMYAQKIEKTELIKMNKDRKRDRPEEQSQPQYKKRFYNKYSPMVSNYRVSHPNSQEGSGGGSTFERSRCTTCGKENFFKCLSSTDGCFGCGN